MKTDICFTRSWVRISTQMAINVVSIILCDPGITKSDIIGVRPRRYRAPSAITKLCSIKDRDSNLGDKSGIDATEICEFIIDVE